MGGVVVALFVAALLFVGVTVVAVAGVAVFIVVAVVVGLSELLLVVVVACCRNLSLLPLIGLFVGSNMLFLSQLLVLTTFFPMRSFVALSCRCCFYRACWRPCQPSHPPKCARQPHCSIWRSRLCLVAASSQDNRCVFVSDAVVVVVIVLWLFVSWASSWSMLLWVLLLLSLSFVGVLLW